MCVRKIVAILLLMIFWFSTIGYFHLYRLIQVEVRHTMKVKLEEQLPDDELSIISFAASEKIHWVRKGKEFLHQGKMYDVVRKIDDGSQTVYYCIDDRKETQLVSMMEDMLKDNMKKDKNTSSNPMRVIISSFPTLYFYEDAQVFSIAGEMKLLPENYSLKVLEGHIKNFSPPPIIG